MSEALKLKIDGMHCGSCVRRVQQALEKIAGVTVEQVEIGSASVAYDPQQASPQTIAEAVTRIGFSAREARE